MSKVLSKEMVLGSPFYPHDCGGMIECVTYRDALKSMDEFANQEKRIEAINFYVWIVRTAQSLDTPPSELYELFYNH